MLSKKLLKDAGKNNSMAFDAQDLNDTAKALLALIDGIASHLLINQSGDLKDKKFWFQ
ncbi:MAG: hypothetical protein M3250_07685 [Thermoproteota archaeon]|nr:hypothetical protein [Thermoproteota archaeon]